MSIPLLTGTWFTAQDPARPLLVLVPGLGTSAAALWSDLAPHLADSYSLLALDLPGHGRSAAAGEGFTMAELAQAVHSAASSALGAGQNRYFYAGNSLGGAIGLQLALDYPEELGAVAVICSGAFLGESQGWRDRGSTVLAQGTPVMVDGSARRWFGADFIAREPAVASRLLHSLSDTDRFNYAFCCEALADYDLRPRLAEVQPPVLAVFGTEDAVAPEASAREVADGVRDGTAIGFERVAHQAPAEAPEATGRVLHEYFDKHGAGE